jgi:hypothetical protein
MDWWFISDQGKVIQYSYAVFAKSLQLVVIEDSGLEWLG